MLKKNTITLFIVMIIMVGGFFLLRQKGWVDFATKKEPTSTPLPVLIDLDTNSVDIITYILAGTDKVVIQRTEGNNWKINIEGGIITAGNIEHFLSTLNSIRPSVVLEVVPEVSEIGLDNPTQMLSITLKDGKEHIINIGNLNPIQTGYYVQIDFGKVVLINKGSIESLLAIIRNAQYPPTPTPPSTG